MMLLLVGDDLPDRCRGSSIDDSKFCDLFVEVAKDDTLDSYRGRSDCPGPNQAGQYSKGKTAKATKVKTLASAHASAGHLGSEQVAMSPLVRQKLVELGQQRWCPPARYPTLRAVNADRPVLAGMIDLQNSIADGSRGSWGIHWRTLAQASSSV